MRRSACDDRRPASMRTYLLLLVAVAAVPLALVAGFLVTTSWLKERAALERGVLDTTRALTLGVDQQLETSIASLQVLAGSDDLTSGNLRAFYRDAAGALRAHPDWDNLLVIDAAGERQLVNLRRPYGAPLPAVARPDAVQPALGSRRPFVSDLHEGRLSQGPLISITVPVVREGVVRYALSANVRPQTFGRLLARQKFETGWICSIVDGEHRFIASSRGPHVIGEPASETLRQKRTELDEGGYRSVTIEGVRSYSALKHSALSRWVVAMATPAARVDASLWQAIGLLATLGLAGGLLGVAAAFVIGRRVARSTRALAASAEALVRGEAPPASASAIREIDQVGDAIRHAAAQRRQAEEERAALLARERTARAEAEHAKRQAEVLSQISAVLGSSLDYEATLASIARLAVPRLADLCAVNMLESNGTTRRVAVAHVDPAQEARARDVRERWGFNEAGPTAQALRSGRARLLAEVTDEDLTRLATGPEQLALLRALDVRSCMVTPLLGRERVLGAITFVLGPSGRRYGPADLAFAEEVARRAALAVENARLYREARAANSAKDEFLTTLSHELRTPLNAVCGWARMLRGGHLGEEETARALDAIVRNADAQVQLIEDLLDMSRIVSGKLRLDMTVVDLRTVVDTALDAVRPAAEAKGIRIETQLGLRPSLVKSDPARLQQVVWNLAANAVKFTPGGGQVTVTLGRAGTDVAIVVSDTGKGIAPALLPHVFERFRQADSSSTRAHGGLGLGLALVRELVELHGGAVAAESAGEGKGATFTVTLRVTSADAGDPARTERRPLALRPSGTAGGPAALRGVQVLVVDDEEDARELIGAILHQAGADVSLCASVSEAVSAVARARPDVVVSDLEMPGEDGYALMRKLRGLAGRPGKTMPAIALTAYTGVEHRVRSLAAGFDTHVAKPIDPAELVSLIARLTAR